MAHLFKFTGKVVYPNEETLLIEPYKKIWSRDKSENKEQAMKEFSYMEFMTSLLASNPYIGYDERRRHRQLCKDIMMDADYVPDELVELGMQKIREFQQDASPSLSFYEASLKGINKLKTFFNTFNMNERNDKGFPIFKPKEITSALLDVDKAIASLYTLKKKVEEEVFEAVKTKGDKTISPFAKLSSLKK